MTLDRDLDAAEAAELRLEARSRERREELARRARRRRLRLWILAPLVLPALGAAALVAALEREGGDFGGWPAWRVALVLAGRVPRPGASSRRGWRGAAACWRRIAWASPASCIEVVLVFGVGFLLLDYGPR